MFSALAALIPDLASLAGLASRAGASAAARGMVASEAGKTAAGAAAKSGMASGAPLTLDSFEARMQALREKTDKQIDAWVAGGTNRPIPSPTSAGQVVTLGQLMKSGNGQQVAAGLASSSVTQGAPVSVGGQVTASTQATSRAVSNPAAMPVPQSPATAGGGRGGSSGIPLGGGLPSAPVPGPSPGSSGGTFEYFRRLSEFSDLKEDAQKAAAGLFFLHGAGVVTARGLGQFAEKIAENNRRLSRWSGTIAVSFAQLDIRKQRLQMSEAGATANSAAALNRALGDLMESFQPIKSDLATMMNFMAIITSKGLQLLTMIAKWHPLIAMLAESAKIIEKNTKPAGVDADPFATFIGGLRNLQGAGRAPPTPIGPKPPLPPIWPQP